MRKHRGPAPEDSLFFDHARVKRLKQAVCDLSWLLGRGYAPGAALVFVGNHFQLTDRERLALIHAAGDGAGRRHQATFTSLKGKKVCVDGFNLVITLETALGGGIVLIGEDGCYRDIADIHGSYALRAETETAVELALTTLKNAEISEALWLFDRPVSNSGRVAALVNATAERLAIASHAETAEQVDTAIKTCDGVAITADSDILNSAAAWFDLAGWVIRHKIEDAVILDLRCTDAD